MGKRFRFLNFLSRVSGEKVTGQPGPEADLRRQLGELRREMEQLQEEREGQDVTRLCQRLERCQNENKVSSDFSFKFKCLISMVSTRTDFTLCACSPQYLKTKLSKYEKLCFGLDQVFEHYHGPPQEEGSDGELEKDGEELLDLFVENVILRSKQTLQEERELA